MKKLFIFFIFLNFCFYTNNHFAKELLIYADSIDYDSEKNLVAKGNVKIISKDELITSELVIINENEEILILPKNFRYKDEEDNYYFGSSGKFTTDLESGEINDIKLLLNDGSRIVGKQGLRKGKIDYISKGVYSPCDSRIKIKNFICPIWQMEGEKVLHDSENLFLYQKHSKMRIFNVPVLYFPYLVTPSPLRKERKSGFLAPTLSFDFFDTKSSQSTAFPYYFALSQDKELLFTPVIYYGGGVDASQRLLFDYDQLISGGNLAVDLAFDTNLENQNNESWVRDASIVTNYNKNINETYKMSLDSAFQSSPTYLRRTDQNNILNRDNTLSTTLNVDGYNVRNKGDILNFNISGYQVVKNNEDNKNTPTAFPYVKYSTSPNKYKKIDYIQKYSFYNIFRDKATSDHAQQQQKINYNLATDNEFYNYNSKINFRTEFLAQYYNIQNKKIDDADYSGTYGRVFPMTGLYIETPLKHITNNTKITPKISLILNGSQPSSNKVSNEESTNNAYSLLNTASLNRYTGTDKLDNSKRINYGIEINKVINFSLSQSYELDTNSNYNQDVGLKDHMSDLLGNINYSGSKNSYNHDFRINVDQGLAKSQSISVSNNSILGITKVNYSMERVENNSILETGSERLTIDYNSKKIYKYSDLSLSSSFDLIEDNPTEYRIGYKYFDECFGVNLDFNRSFYSDRDLKPKDILTLMFSFKHVGAYKSTNLAVSETDKQEIEWLSEGIQNELFY